MRLKYIIIGGLMLFFNNAFSQQKLAGRVYDKKSGELLTGASILVKETGKGTNTDFEGNYSLSISPGQYTLCVSFIGYADIEEQLTVAGNDIHHDFYLCTATKDIVEIVVAGKGEIQQKREQPFQVSVLDAKPLQIQSKPITALVGQLAGVRVRENGGMGSNVNIILNGIGGKGVRVFVDDIPSDLLGSGMSIRNLPINMLDHIEVFKGYVPSKFGADALGGVLNLVTKKYYSDYLDATAGMGSFGTYQASLNAQKCFGKDNNAYVEIGGYYNHSDNNYWMDDVDILTDELGNTRTGKARRFNDAYTSYSGKATFGLRQQSWADIILLNVSGGYTYKEWQHGVTANTPWGEPFSKTKNINTDLRWKKYGIWNDKLDLSFTAGYGYRDLYFEDIAAKTYYWGADDGLTQWVEKATVGEAGVFLNGRNPHTFTHKEFSRINAVFHINEKHSLSFTSLLRYMRMQGHDYRGVASFGSDVFENPQTLFRNYIGLSLESNFFEDKLTNILLAKHFYGKAKIAELNDAAIYTGQQTNEYSEFCYGDAVKYLFSENLSAIASYEYTLRLPDEKELFGDFITIYPNVELKPERSHNADLGLRFQTFDNKISAELNGFYRYTSDLIFLRTLIIYRSVYMNLETAETKGVNCEVKYSPLEELELYANATYQDIRLKELSENSDLSTKYINNRIPNKPYLFGNAGANYTLPLQFSKTDKIQCFYSLNYVHEFFLTWEADGSNSTKTTIPKQLVHNIGVSYSFLDEKFSVSGECHNITDEKVYDNYSVQKPGRSFYVKLRYSIK